MRLIRFWLIIGLTFITGSIHAASVNSPKPHMPVVNGNLHLTYSVQCVEKALPPEAIEATVAELTRRGGSHLKETIEGYRASTKDRTISEYSVDLWIASPNCARWQIGIYNMILDGKNAVTLISNKKRATDLLIKPINTSGAGSTYENIPFLGIPMVNKQYEGKDRRITRTEQGWVEHTTLTHGYRCDSDGKPQKINAELTYDKLGRLVQFERDTDLYEYSDFATIGSDTYYPRTVIHKDRNIFVVNDPDAVGQVTTYKVTAVDTKKMPKNFFTFDKLPVGTVVNDIRYTSPNAPNGVRYTYDGRTTIDKASLLALKNAKPHVVPPPEEPPFIIVGKPLDFTFFDMNHNNVRMSDLHGKVILIDVWATWCGFCVKEIPDLVDLQAQAEKEKLPLQIIGASVDRDWYQLHKYLIKTTVNYPVISVCGSKEFRGVHLLPTKFIIDKNGIVVDEIRGSLDINELRTRLQKYE